ncbi:MULTISPECIES: hypothetical protein [unclassified Streptomyces]|uniref:hypothetical protein n=1 Tax=unclassified Streptomyces TaxID=2593676 RepID=UPI001E299D26|nr:hypothetical protein [Streptomyces sp. CB02980]MCB8906809.1 hypothetical protein [Streptomyces sp. CB02980]
MPVKDPCGDEDRQVCAATRTLARAILRRLAVNATAIEPRTRGIVATRGGGPWVYDLWKLCGDDGEEIKRFDLTKRPDPAWGKVAADMAQLIRLADLRTHPHGYYFVFPLEDARDFTIILPAHPHGPAPRRIGSPA